MVGPARTAQSGGSVARGLDLGGCAVQPAVQLGDETRDLAGDVGRGEPDLGHHLGAGGVVEEARRDAEVAQRHVDVRVAERLGDGRADTADAAVVLDGDDEPVTGREAGQGLSLNLVPKNLTADRWTAVLLLFHDHEWEHALLDWALRTPAFYIGAQGGAPAREERVEKLVDAGHPADDIARIHSPIGLIPRARDSQVLALSALADVVGAYEKLHPHQ